MHDNDGRSKIIDGRKHFLLSIGTRIVLVGSSRFKPENRFLRCAIIAPLLSTAPSDAGRTAAEPSSKPNIIDAGVTDIYIASREKARARGNGFGYGMVYPDNPESVKRARYLTRYKDGGNSDPSWLGIWRKAK